MNVRVCVSYVFLLVHVGIGNRSHSLDLENL